MPRASKQVKMPRGSRPTTDAILPLQDPYMSQIINGAKNYEFRKYCLKQSVKRIWFYRTAPHSAITHVCEILSARTRNPGDAPLEENGLGNAEFNSRHKDWDGYDFAYKLLSVYELRKPVPLAEMRAAYGLKAAPQSLVYLPQLMGTRIVWHKQILIRENEDASLPRGGPSNRSKNHSPIAKAL